MLLVEVHYCLSSGQVLQALNKNSDNFAVRSLSLLILCCGDVESNPGPPKVQPGPSKTAPSETIRKFTRSFQPELVRLIYEANDEPTPKAMYKQSPPGWDSLNDGIEFKSICNAKRGGNEIFDKLIKLYKRTVKTIPNDILDVIICYENLRDSTLKNEETEKWKTTLEKFISNNKLKKKLQNLNEESIVTVLKTCTELLTQGVIRLTNDAVISAYHDFGDALIKQTGEKQVCLINSMTLVHFTICTYIHLGIYY